MAKLRRPHVVPCGYQRNFALGKRILVIDKAAMTDRLVGVRDNFVASHFLRVFIAGQPSDLAEDAFARIENVVLPLVKSLRPFEQRTEDQTIAVKAAMAMLWSRSFSREVTAQRVHLEVLDVFRRSVPDDPRARHAFRRQHGRDPMPGELEAVVEESAAQLLHDRLHDVSRMMKHYGDALDRFRPLHVSLYAPIRGTEFVTSDNPVLLARTNQLIHVGAQNRLALDDASFIFLPVSRSVGACLTLRDEGDVELDRMTMLRLNQAMWRNAVTRVACHPSVDWRTACNLRRS
ncbi:MAG: DUF4238 domain-containing protein [Acidimicrobiales bacterium]|nr:DUF4238 domain-containing protein [Acidimicrobiales bacterium]